MGMLAQMRDDLLHAPRPDVFSLTTVMDACITGNRPDLALQLFDNAKGNEGNEMSSSLKLHHCLNTIFTH